MLSRSDHCKSTRGCWRLPRCLSTPPKLLRSQRRGSGQTNGDSSTLASKATIVKTTTVYPPHPVAFMILSQWQIFTPAVIPDVMSMVKANVCRALPPQPDDCDPDRDEPLLEEAWPHLQVCVYQRRSCPVSLTSMCLLAALRMKAEKHRCMLDCLNSKSLQPTPFPTSLLCIL